MPNRSEYLKQLDEVDAAIKSLTDKTVEDLKSLKDAVAGDEDACERVQRHAKSERRSITAIEGSCLDIMLLQQPLVGDDLRFVSGLFRLVSDVSHIGEMARDVAYLVSGLPAEVTAKLADHLSLASDKVASMLAEAVEAFRNSDVDRARAVFAADDNVDDIYLAAEQVVIDLIKSSETRAKYLPELLMVAKYFERMGDDAVRVADWAVFRVTGVHEVHKGTSAPADAK